MKYSLTITPMARVEIDDAIEWYNQRDPDVADQFEAAVEQALVRIVQQPFLHPFIFEDFRAVRTRGFLYRVIYTVHEKSIEVTAVFHDRRNPSEWQARH